MEYGARLDLSTLPACALESSDADVRQRVAELVATVAHWRGFGTSAATEVLHKKRPALIPILDNPATFGACLDPRWPGRPSGQDSVYAVNVVRAALDHLVIDLTRPENLATWQALPAMEPARSRIELFDMVWWMYFRELEPVQRAGARAGIAAVATDADESAAHVSPTAVGRVNPATAAPADEPLEVVDEGMHLLIGLRPVEVSVLVRDVAVERHDR